MAILPCGAKISATPRDTPDPNDTEALGRIDIDDFDGEARRAALLRDMYQRSLKDIADVVPGEEMVAIANADVPEFCEDISARAFGGCNTRLCAKKHEHHRHWECRERKIRCRWLVNGEGGEWIEHCDDHSGKGRPAWGTFHKHMNDHEKTERDLFLEQMRTGFVLTKFGRGGRAGHARRFVLQLQTTTRSQRMEPMKLELLWGKPGAGEATYKKIDWKQIQLISHVSFQQQSHGSSSSDELPFSPVFGKSELVKSPSEAERDRRAKRCFTLWFTDNTSMMRNGVRAMWGTGSSYKHTLDVECASEDARNFLVQGFMLLWKHTWKDQGYNPDDFCGFQIDSFGRYKFKQYEKTGKALQDLRRNAT